jgi:multiple sugar transport system ATP-binding protein
MNFLEGTIQRSNGTISVALGNHRLELGASLVQQRPLLEAYRDKEVFVGIRPENLHDAALVPATPANGVLHGTVELREELGPELFIHFNAPGLQVADTTSIADLPRDTAGMLVGRFDPRSHVREGGAVDAVVDTASLRFFDPATGRGIYGGR